MEVGVFPVERDYAVMECGNFLLYFHLYPSHSGTITFPETKLYLDPASQLKFFGDGPI